MLLTASLRLFLSVGYVCGMVQDGLQMVDCNSSEKGYNVRKRKYYHAFHGTQVLTKDGAIVRLHQIISNLTA